MNRVLSSYSTPRQWIVTACCLLTSSFIAGNALAGGNAAQGEKLATSKICVTCHGPAGNAPISPDYPRLAGQHGDYLENALHEYKNGARKDPVMSAQAAGLSQQEILDLAAYFSSQSGSLATRY
jgi:cytochrome c553